MKCLEQMHRLDPKSIAAVLTLDDHDDSRSAFKQFQSYTAENKIKLYIAKDKKDSENIISQVKPEICFVVGWYWLISKKILDLVPNGFLGIHHSLLPQYRGGSPLVWALINGEKTVGTSLFSFTEGMDDGNIWAQEKVEVNKDDYITDLLEKLEGQALSIIQDKYLAILESKITPVPQKHADATFCSQRIPEDGLIDWRKNADEVYNFIRAQSEPYPGAFTYLNDEKLTIWRAHPENMTYFGKPGQVAMRSGDFVTVICGDNKPIVLEEVSIKGSKSTAAKIIKSIKTRL